MLLSLDPARWGPAWGVELVQVGMADVLWVELMQLVQLVQVGILSLDPARLVVHANSMWMYTSLGAGCRGRQKGCQG